MALKIGIPIEELEKRMRPGAYSTVGFLGTAEALESVLHQDELALRRMGITYEKISTELRNILLDVSIQKHKLWEENPKESTEREMEEDDFLLHWRGRSVFSLDNLPDPEMGIIVGNKYQVLFLQSRGMQACPWDCVLGLDFHWSSIDFLLLNRQSSNYIFAPGLIAHLIQKHHFFEGTESPYRVEPYKLAQVLGLVS